MLKTVKILNVFFVFIFLTISIFAQSAGKSIEGVWNVAFDSSKMHFPALMEFVREDSKISASILIQPNITIDFSKGDFQENTLSISGNATYNNMKIPLSLTAQPSGDSLTGKWKAFLVGEGTIKGIRVTGKFSEVSRGKIFDDVWQIVGRNFYSPSYNGVDWNDVKKNYRDRVTASKSFYEMSRLINEMLAKLKSSHLGFAPNLTVADDAKNPREKNVEWKKINETTGYIKVKEFDDASGESEKLVNQAFDELGNLPSMIVDLRDNPGGGIEVALPLARHLFAKKQCVGYFYDRTAAAKLKIDSLEELKRQDFPVYSSDILPGNSHASKLVINGLGDKAYQGKVAVLINEADYSTTEAFAAAFKESGRGILVGRKTGGQMLAAEYLTIGKVWTLVVPIADFKTCGGFRVEGNGVEPEISVAEDDSDDAILAKAIALLKK